MLATNGPSGRGRQEQAPDRCDRVRYSLIPGARWAVPALSVAGCCRLAPGMSPLSAELSGLACLSEPAVRRWPVRLRRRATPDETYVREDCRSQRSTKARTQISHGRTLD